MEQQHVRPSRQAQDWQIVCFVIVGSLLGILIGTGILLVLAMWHEVLQEAWLMGLDQSVQNGLHQMASPTLTSLMFVLTTLGSLVVLLAVAGPGIVLLSLYKRWYEAVSFLIAMGGAVVLNHIAKISFHRPRPAVVWALVRENSYSFPSCHATMSLVFYGMIAYFLFSWLRHSPRTRMALILVLTLLVGGIGLSRVYLGVHYPGDIVAGFLGGAIWLSTVIVLTKVARRVPHFFPVSPSSGIRRAASLPPNHLDKANTTRT